jgi:hypothetical protein
MAGHPALIFSLALGNRLINAIANATGLSKQQFPAGQDG